jgi:hypothetical protein
VTMLLNMNCIYLISGISQKIKNNQLPIIYILLVYVNNLPIFILKIIHNQMIRSLVLRFSNVHIIIKGENSEYGILYHW